MARTGRGWDAKPPAPKRQSAASGSDEPEPPEYRGRSLPWSNRDEAPPPVSPSWSLPWSNADEARTAALARERRPNLDGADGGAHASDNVPGDRPRRRDRSAAGDRGWSGPQGEPGDRGRRSRRRWNSQESAGEEPERAEAPRDPYETAREICLRQLALRPRTRAELAAVLKKRGISDEVSAAVLDRYSEVGMIDDAAFAKAWVTTRHHSRGLASRALAQELRRKGVDQEVTESALSELDSDTEAQTALDLALRKLRTTRGEPEAVFRRLVGMLARKGYPGGVAVRAVKEALATRDAELADLIDPDAYDE